MLHYLTSLPLAILLQDAYFTTSNPLASNAVDHHRAHAILPCQCFCSKGGAGISTCCPSPTTIVLGLGPDLPWADEPSPGNLGPSTVMFLASLSLLIPALSLLYPPQVLSVLLHRYTMLLYRSLDPIASASRFSPGHLRRSTTRPVSYYALFKCVAASEPTSWLSVRSHILLHLTCTWGP